MKESLRLTRELVDEVIFGMENQECDYFLDSEEEVVVPEDQLDPDAEEDRYLPLPEWRSVDGYNLMERFVASLHNPVFRERLRAILASGRGVFRQFKDTVRERREIERLWFAFKDCTMRRVVTDWFNDLRELEGLERLEELPSETETDELVESDFVFVPARPEHIPVIRRLDREAFDEIYGERTPRVRELMYLNARVGVPEIGTAECDLLVTETGDAELVGFIRAARRSTAAASAAVVVQLYVVPEYRGLGVGRGLFRAYRDAARAAGVDELLLQLAGTGMDVEERFLSYGMERHSVTLRMDLTGFQPGD